MKKRFIPLFVMAFIFSFNLAVFADEGHDDEVKKATENFRNGTSGEQQEHSDGGDHQVSEEEHSDDIDAHQESEDNHGEATSEHSETDGHDEGSDEDNHSSGETDGGHEAEADEGHHGPVVETPPNYKVLGTYGAVNFIFIFIGIWNKWFRRKGK